MVFLIVFFIITVFLFVIDFVPETPKVNAEVQSSMKTTTSATSVVSHSTLENPTQILIEKIGVDMPIANPTSTDINALDEALLGGVVRYPGSGLVGEDANMFLFGHSSYLPVVHNQAFRAFNDLGKLKADDLIRVRSATVESIYRVETVAHAAASDVEVELSHGEKKLTLTTCDSFGKKSDRFIVTAAFVGSYPLSSSL